MARYKHYCYEQGKMIPISFREQILPGTFEYTLSYLIDHELDLSAFDERYSNDDTGRPAYDPALLLKIVLYAYARGIISSRQIERCCRENVIFMALSADSQPHFTTIADFISRMEGEIVALFRNVLMICDAQGLIGREMLPSTVARCRAMPARNGVAPRRSWRRRKRSSSGRSGACCRRTGSATAGRSRPRWLSRNNSTWPR
jgi:transposase